jgi:steroid Delta-isomerase
MSYAEQHVDAFNHAVETGSWRPFVDRFADDATLEFVGPPVGPFQGRAAIMNAYTHSPPDDKIDINGRVLVDGADLVVPYKWRTTGATGTMSITTRGEQITRLTITFD